MWWWSAVFILLCISLAIEVAYAVKTRKFKFIAGSAIMLYAVALLSWVVFMGGVGNYFVRSGLFTALLIVALMCLHMIDLIACNETKRKRNED